MLRRTSVLVVVLSWGLVGCAAEEQSKEGPAVRAVRSAECRRAGGPIRINGILDDSAWDNAQPLKDFAVFWQKRKPATATTAKLLWDNSYLYFSAEMEDED